MNIDALVHMSAGIQIRAISLRNISVFFNNFNKVCFQAFYSLVYLFAFFSSALRAKINSFISSFKALHNFFFFFSFLKKLLANLKTFFSIYLFDPHFFFQDLVYIFFPLNLVLAPPPSSPKIQIFIHTTTIFSCAFS
jgi:hypothetical protein